MFPFYLVLIPFGYTFAIWSIWITCSSFNKFKFEYILMYSVYTISQTNKKRTTHFWLSIVLCWHSLVWTLKCVCAHTHTCLRTLFKISQAKFNIYCWLSIWPGAGEYFGRSAHIHRVAASASILIENMCTHTHTERTFQIVCHFALDMRCTCWSGWERECVSEIIKLTLVKWMMCTRTRA